MKKELIVTGIQADLIWENPEANRALFDTHLKSISEDTDLIVLPEMFTTGFSMEPQRIAESFHPEKMTSLKWMRSWAASLNACITGSIAVEEGGMYYNRLIWVSPDGSVSHYNKRHLFQMAGEHKQYESGNTIVIEQIHGWKICPLVCYDLRFPIWSRNKLIEGDPMYDVLLYVANWPAVRSAPWKKLLLARAIENQAYLIGINRVGTDGTSIQYSGDSCFVNSRGEYLQEFTPNTSEVRTQAFSANELLDFRDKFPVLSDADDFQML
jgi:omega-amidase